MSLDVSKTETFIPLIWIASKYVYVFVAVSVLLDPDTSLVQINTNAYTHAQRAVVVVLLCSILTENAYDITVLRRSALMERMYQDGKNVSYVGFLLDACFIVVYMQLHCLRCDNPQHGALSINATSVDAEHTAVTDRAPSILFAWALVGTCRAGVDLVYRHSARTSMPPALAKAHVMSLNVLYVCMSITLTSTSLRAVCMHMTVHEVLFRLAFYAALLVIRCYSEGLSAGVSSDIHSLCLFGWSMLVPLSFLYVLTVFCAACYAVLYAVTTKHPTSPPSPARIPVLPVVTIDESILNELNMRAPTSRRKTGALF